MTWFGGVYLPAILFDFSWEGGAGEGAGLAWEKKERQIRGRANQSGEFLTYQNPIHGLITRLIV